MNDGLFGRGIKGIAGKESLNQAKKFLFAHGNRFVLLVGVLCVGALAFEAGILQGSMSQSKPIVLSLPATPTVSEDSTAPPPASSATTGLERIVSGGKSSGLPEGCMFVGSRNSDKYHLTTCAVAKRIKPENRICFASKADAEKRGYVAGCLK